MSYRILKRVEIVPESELQRLDNFVTAEEKGYPSVISPLKIVAEFDDETNRLKGYTSFKDLGKFHFVGNGYVYDREGGVYRFNTDRASEYKNFLFDTLKKVAPYRIYNRVDLGNNDYDIYFTEQQREFFNKVLEISKVAPVSAGVIDKWEDNSDIMTDYFDVTYYTTVRFECRDFFKD